MKTYYITLKRLRRRATHIKTHVNKLELDCIKVPAVDGKNLTREDILKECDVEHFVKKRASHWPIKGTIGCTLSHKQAYTQFLTTPAPSAFIIEDDAVLPTNIKSILNDIAKVIQPDEVVLLYHIAIMMNPIDVSNLDSKKLPNSDLGLYFPMELKGLFSSAAYCIGREAANGILNTNTPIKAEVDRWDYFYSQGAFNSLRILYPSPITIKNFKSSVGYPQKGGLRKQIANFSNKYKIPILYQYQKKRQADRLKQKENNITLVDRKSPLFGKITTTAKM